MLANVADVKSFGNPPGVNNSFTALGVRNSIEQGIKPNTIRLSIGIENVQDLIEALDKAFKAVE